jgi:pyrimidine operon attenuation protein/uracil phosphoribosyltransferase
MPESSVILNALGIQRALTRIAHEITERNETTTDVVLVGIPRGGVPLAEQLGKSSLASSTKPSRSVRWT